MTYLDELREELTAKMNEHRAAMEAMGRMLKALNGDPPGRAAKATAKPKARKRLTARVPDEVFMAILAEMPDRFSSADLGQRLGISGSAAGQRMKHIDSVEYDSESGLWLKAGTGRFDAAKGPQRSEVL